MAELRLPLRPGDTILSLGTGIHSKGIMGTTGGRHSHATIFTGSNVIEATLPRVQEIDLHTFSKKTEYMDAYRHRESDGRGDRIVDEARRFLARDYSKIDLVLASAVGAFTAWIQVPSPWLALNTQFQVGRLRPLLAQLRELLKAYTSGKLTCVELVVRAHARAGLPIVVKLDPGGTMDFALLWESAKSLYELNRKAGKVFESIVNEAEFLRSLEADLTWAAGIQREIRLASPPVGARFGVDDLEAPIEYLKALELVAGDEGPRAWDPAFVTPNQLASSPSFQELGGIPTAALG